MKDKVVLHVTQGHDQLHKPLPKYLSGDLGAALDEFKPGTSVMLVSLKYVEQMETELQRALNFAHEEEALRVTLEECLKEERTKRSTQL